MKIKLQEAVERMTMNPGNGDICIGPAELGFQIDDNRIIVEGDSDRPYPFLLADFYGEKWEIIPAKPKPAPESEKVLTPQEWLKADEADLSDVDPNGNFEYIYYSAKFQGRLERDLELRVLVKKEIPQVIRILRSVSLEGDADRLESFLQNLKPLKAE